MALWDDLKADVITWTNRPALVAETELALKQAIRLAHKQGKFWRDMTTVTVNPAVQQIQSINLQDDCPRMRQLNYVKSGTYDKYYDETAALDLLDADRFARVNVYWGIGNTLNIRSEAPETSYEIAYYRQPVTSPPESISDWLLTDYQDVVVLLAASAILGAVGEQEIKGQVDKFLAIAVADLISDNIEVTGR